MYSKSPLITTVSLKFRNILLFLISVILLVSCVESGPIRSDGDKIGDYLDPDLRLGRNDYKEALIPQREIDRNSSIPSIPQISPIITNPIQPSVGTDKLVTIAVTDDVPLKDVLIELGRLADVDMEIDPAIQGGVIFRVKNKPFDKVIQRVARLGGLRYSVEDGIVRVERDLPYIKNYPVDFLNIVRSSSGGVSINTQVLGGGNSESAGEGITGGSNNSITTQYEGDLWKSIESGLQSILAFNANTSLASNGSSGVEGLSSALSVSTSSQSATFNINKQAGMISILANANQHKNVTEYLQQIKRQVSAQVLIEAKIVEVALNEDYQTGIDWGTLSDGNLGLSVTSAFQNVPTSAGNFLTIRGINSINTAVSMTEKFGVSRTLSSPRLHAMNNQQAVLTFAENRVYFTLEVQEEIDGEGADANETLTIESTLNTVPIGVILTLQPSINLETQEVTMNIRPTLSRITSSVNDPAVDLIVARNNNNNSGVDVTSEIPIIEVRELDSVMKIKSGQIMVIGGLMRDINSNDDIGVPYMSDIPFFGNLFKSVSKTSSIVETIIFIQATIVDNGETYGVSEPDRNVYEKFMRRDPRPMEF